MCTNYLSEKFIHFETCSCGGVTHPNMDIGENSRSKSPSYHAMFLQKLSQCGNSCKVPQHTVVFDQTRGISGT